MNRRQIHTPFFPANDLPPRGSMARSPLSERATSMHPDRQSIGRQRAITMASSNWWVNRTPREIAKFQLFTIELCLPFNVFHRAVETALGRPVMIHEFGFNVGGLIQEILGERDPPTLKEILALLPAGKRQTVFVEEQFS